MPHSGLWTKKTPSCRRSRNQWRRQKRGAEQPGCGSSRRERRGMTAPHGKGCTELAPRPHTSPTRRRAKIGARALSPHIHEFPPAEKDRVMKKLILSIAFLFLLAGGGRAGVIL